MVLLKHLKHWHDDQLRQQWCWHGISFHQQSQSLNRNQNCVLIAQLQQLQYLLTHCYDHDLALLLFEVQTKFEVLYIGECRGDCLVLHHHALTWVDDFHHLLEHLLGGLFFAVLEEALVTGYTLQEPHTSQRQNGRLLELRIIGQEFEHLLGNLLINGNHILQLSHEVQGHLCI